MSPISDPQQASTPDPDPEVDLSISHHADPVAETAAITKNAKNASTQQRSKQNTRRYIWPDIMLYQLADHR